MIGRLYNVLLIRFKGPGSTVSLIIKVCAKLLSRHVAFQAGMSHTLACNDVLDSLLCNIKYNGKLTSITKLNQTIQSCIRVVCSIYKLKNMMHA